MAGGFKILRGRVPASNLAITVTGAPSKTAATVGIGYAFDSWATGGTEPYTYAFNGTLPSGVGFDTTQGGGSGFPTTGQTRSGCSVTVTDALGHTATSASFTIVVTDPSWNNVPVANDAALFNAITNANPGDRLVLAAGTYSEIDRFSTNKSGVGIMIDGSAGVNMPYVFLDTCSGIWVKAITLTGVKNSSQAAGCGSSDRIVLDALVIHSCTATGIHGGESTNLIIQNNDIATVAGDGINTVVCSNVLVTTNKIVGFSGNGQQHLGDTNGIYEKSGTSIYNENDSGHPDSLAMGGFGGMNASRITCRWNHFERSTGDVGCQGIGFIDGDIGASIDNCNIYTNCSFGCGGNGSQDAGTTYCSKRNNFVQAWSGDPDSIIYTRDGSDHSIQNYNFSNNPDTASFVALNPGAPPPYSPTNYTVSGNTTIPEATSSSDTGARNTFLANNPLIATA